MDYSKSMGTPSTNLPSAPPSYQASTSDPPPPYSAQPPGYGFSQQYVTSIDQQLNQHNIQQTVFIGQQHPSVESTMQGSPVNDYFGYAIFTMLCCFPLGIVALANSIATRDANARGDRQMAELSSRRALMMSHSALGTGIGIFAISITMIVFVFVA